MTIPKIDQRRIGAVAILDIKGSFTGPWASRGKEELMYHLKTTSSGNAILNLRSLTHLDSLGARAILESIPNTQGMAILAGNRQVMDLVTRYSGTKQLRLFWNEREAVRSFGKTFIGDSSVPIERRAHPRMPTALPLEFYNLEEAEPIYFCAVVTNLSLGGLFAEYIDLKYVEESLEHLDPYDLKLLHLNLLLSKGKAMEAEGKVVHRRLDGEQLGIGIEFYKLDPKDQQEIRNFLKKSESRYEL